MTVKQLIVQLEELDVGRDAVVKVYEHFVDEGFNTLNEAQDVEVHDMYIGEKVPAFVVIW